MGNREQLDEMGKRILDASRTELYLSMRFLGPALHSLGFIMDLSTTTVGTDAAYIRFNPNYLFRLYVDRPRLLNRTWLHLLLHCVFRHMFTAKEKEDRELWDLASDIAVGYILDSMEYPAIAELTPEFRQRVYDRLESEIKVLTAERIYQYFLQRKRNYLEELQLRAAFALCDHSFWERMEDEEDQAGGDREDSPQDRGEEDAGPRVGERKEEKKAPDKAGDKRAGRDPENPEGKRDPENPEEKEAPDKAGDKKAGRDPENPEGKRAPENPERKRDPENLQGNKAPENSGENRQRKVSRLKAAKDLEGEWEDKSRRVEAQILASGKKGAEERGSLDRILAVSNRRRTDYREFLRKFAVLREVTSVDPDSFDYGFYNYGMELYGNMPLIEENEYREVRQIRTLVIAIDTSASCQDVLVQRFINETAAVLRSVAGFFHSCEIHIIECDEHVQHEIVVHDCDELDRYAAGFHVKGGFGTDFRPVFSYVEEKRKTGGIKNPEGLMYFTDGMGIYPEKATDYDTAFVFFRDEDLDDTKVPDWAIRLYIDGDRLEKKLAVESGF